MTQDMLSAIQAAQQGDREAGGRLIEENSGLIWSVARRFSGGAPTRRTCISSAASVF